MKYYNITQPPLKIYGLAVANAQTREFYKLPKTMLEQMPRYDYLGRRATGGRVRFCTDSANLTIRMTLRQTKEDINIIQWKKSVWKKHLLKKIQWKP